MTCKLHCFWPLSVTIQRLANPSISRQEFSRTIATFQEVCEFIITNKTRQRPRQSSSSIRAEWLLEINLAAPAAVVIDLPRITFTSGTCPVRLWRRASPVMLLPTKMPVIPCPAAVWNLLGRPPTTLNPSAMTVMKMFSYTLLISFSFLKAFCVLVCTCERHGMNMHNLSWASSFGVPFASIFKEEMLHIKCVA